MRVYTQIKVIERGSKLRFDISKYKRKVMQLVESRNMVSCMNTTKWNEFRDAVLEEMPFSPPFIIKDIFEEDKDKLYFSHFQKDVNYLGDWDYVYFYPFVGIEWIKVRPRYIKFRGNLIEGDIMDATNKFIEILNKYTIPYVEEDGLFTIWGYK